MSGKLSIVPFVNNKGEERFKILGKNGNSFLNAFGNGYHTKESAYVGLVMFAHNRYKKTSIDDRIYTKK